MAGNPKVEYTVVQYLGDKGWTVRRTISDDYCVTTTKSAAEKLIQKLQQAALMERKP